MPLHINAHRYALESGLSLIFINTPPAGAQSMAECKNPIQPSRRFASSPRPAASPANSVAGHVRCLDHTAKLGSIRHKKILELLRCAAYWLDAILHQLVGDFRQREHLRDFFLHSRNGCRRSAFRRADAALRVDHRRPSQRTPTKKCASFSRKNAAAGRFAHKAPSIEFIASASHPASATATDAHHQTLRIFRRIDMCADRSGDGMQRNRCVRRRDVG